MMKFRKSNYTRLDPASARRQGDMTRLALVLLGREDAITFMNTQNAALGARPIDLVVESEAGRILVEGELGRLTNRQA
jgi:uncharacterized protein (DUF2384 family)